jgi:hypothetical protein
MEFNRNGVLFKYNFDIDELTAIIAHRPNTSTYINGNKKTVSHNIFNQESIIMITESGFGMLMNIIIYQVTRCDGLYNTLLAHGCANELDDLKKMNNITSSGSGLSWDYVNKHPDGRKFDINLTHPACPTKCQHK